MTTKKYILKDKDVGFLASSIAMQEGQISLKKDNQSSFYIATVKGEDLHIPEKLQMLEMAVTEESPKNTPEAIMGLPNKPQENSTEIVLRLHINQTIAPENIPVLYNEITKAVDSVIKNIDD